MHCVVPACLMHHCTEVIQVLLICSEGGYGPPVSCTRLLGSCMAWLLVDWGLRDHCFWCWYGRHCRSRLQLCFGDSCKHAIGKTNDGCWCTLERVYYVTSCQCSVVCYWTCILKQCPGCHAVVMCCCCVLSATVHSRTVMCTVWQGPSVPVTE